MQNKRVLVIEDDVDAANVLEAYLKREGYNVAVVGNGLMGLNTALTWKPDLILLDVMLPDMNGTEILAALRRKVNTPVIMITAMGNLMIKLALFAMVRMIISLNPITPVKLWHVCRQC